MSETRRDQGSLLSSARSDRTVVSRAAPGCGCAARSCADVAAANAFFAERFRPRVAESGSFRSDPRANAARNGRGFGGADGRHAARTYIGRPSLERLLDT